MTSPAAKAWSKVKGGGGAKPARRVAGTARSALARRGLRGVYDGTEQNRQTADWTAASAEPTALTAAWLELLRNRSRSLARTSGVVVSAFTAIKDNVIGADGFRLRPRPMAGDMDPDEIDEDLARILEATWKEHSAGIDVDRRESLTSMLRTAYGEYPEAGEVFVVESTPRGPDIDGVIPQVIELVNAERIDHGLTTAFGHRVRDVDEGNRVTNGIEFTPEGRRAAYHFKRLDEFGLTTFDTDRVVAGRVHHLFHRLRTGQERGLPWLYASTLLAHDLDDLVDAELTSAQVAACLAAFVKTEAGAGMFDGDTTSDRDADDDRPIVGLDPGMVAYLAEGEDVEIADPNRPGGNFTPFASFLIRLLGKSLGPAYETISGDYRGVNFASGRLAHLVERKAYRRMQADGRDLVVRPIYRSFIRRGILAGRLPISPAAYVANPRRYDRVDIQPPGWEHTDPLKEATAAALRILVGISTLDEECAALGRDWRTTIEQRSRELAAMEEKGVPLFTAGGAQPVPAAGAQANVQGLERSARRLGFTNGRELIKALEDGAVDTWIANGGRLNGSANGQTVGAH